MCFFQQQEAELLLEAVDGMQRRPFGQVGQQFHLLIGLGVVAMTAHQLDQATMFGSHRVDLPPAGQEVVVDEPDDMETIGHDQGLGKCFLTSER